MHKRPSNQSGLLLSTAGNLQLPWVSAQIEAMPRLAIWAAVLAVGTSKTSDEVLWGGAKDLAQQVWASPFVQKACSGELGALQFGQYMVQDIGCYMPGAIKVLHGLHERSLKEQGPNSKFTMYFARMYSAYVTYLAAEAKGWDLENIQCSSSCQAYVDFLSDVAKKKPLPQAIIAFAPCTVLWDWLGGRMKSCIRPGNAYNDWIKGLSGSGKAADFSMIDSLVHQALISDPIQSVETFREGMMREYDFFNSVIPGFNGTAGAVFIETSAIEGHPMLFCLGMTYLAALTWARVFSRSRQVMNSEAQQPFLT